MTNYVHSRRVGQNWVKFGPRSCWMSPLSTALLLLKRKRMSFSHKCQRSIAYYVLFLGPSKLFLWYIMVYGTTHKFCFFLISWWNSVLLPKLFWPAVRKNCSGDREKLLKFVDEGQEFAKILRSVEQFIRTVKDQF